MKCKILFPAWLLLLWTLAEPAEITVTPTSDGIKLFCVDGDKKDTPQTLVYNDEQTGEYSCGDGTKIFVKFRTCDNCIALETGSIVGLALGDVVATIVIGVAVYLVASLNPTGPKTSNKKGSDRQPLFPSEMSNRPTNDHYQPLKRVRKDEYGVIKSRT